MTNSDADENTLVLPSVADHGGPPVKGEDEGTLNAFATTVPSEATVSSIMATPTPSLGEEPISQGMLLGHTFLVEERLASGGMGEVFRARHIELNTWHAIKVILPKLVKDPTLVELFRREASSLRQVRHDAVVAYDGINRDEFGRLFLVMEFVDGPSLTAVLRQRALPEAEVAVLLHRIASGLGAAHEKGIVHRDISPDNIILPGGRAEAAKIIDFGIAKQTESQNATLIGSTFAGKLSYASPEQLGMFGGRVDARSDIYSTGLVIAAAARGRPLEMGDSLQSVVERRMRVPELTGVPERLLPILSAMLAPEPDQRPQSMAALIGIIQGSASPVSSRPPSSTRPPSPSPKSSRGMIAAAGGLAMVIALAGGYFVYDRLLGSTPVPPSKSPEPEIVATAPAPSPPPVGTVTPAGGGDPIVATKPPEPVAPVQPQEPMVVAASPPSSPPSSPEPVEPVIAPKAAEPVAVRPEPPPPPPLSLADVQARLREATAGLPCGHVTASQQGDGSFLVSGFVDTAVNASGVLDRLRPLTAPSPGQAQARVETRVLDHPSPFCEALAVALPVSAGGPVRSDRVDISLNKPSGLYRGGDELVVTVTAGLRGGHVTVDLFDNDGSVVHMAPVIQTRALETPVLKADDINPRQSVTLGGSKIKPNDNKRHYPITPPFGTGMILAVVTPRALFLPNRPEVEQAASYLPRLRAALAGTGVAIEDIATEVVFFNTAAK